MKILSIIEGTFYMIIQSFLTLISVKTKDNSSNFFLVCISRYDFVKPFKWKLRLT